MARMRSATYIVAGTVPATDSLVLTADGLLRDILPDQGFRLHSIVGYLQSSLDAGDAMTAALGKNVTATTAFILGQVAVKHGLLTELVMTHVAAAGVKESVNFVIPFPQPVDFDQNDSLNLEVTGTNAAATSQAMYLILGLQYEAA